MNRYEKNLGIVILFLFPLLSILSSNKMMWLASGLLGLLCSLFIVPQRMEVWNRWTIRILFSLVWSGLFTILQVGASKLFDKDVSLLILNFVMVIVLLNVVQFLFGEETKKSSFAKMLVTGILFIFVGSFIEMFLRGAIIAEDPALRVCGSVGVAFGYVILLTYCIEKATSLLGDEFSNKNLLTSLNVVVKKMKQKYMLCLFGSVFVLSLLAIPLTLVYIKYKDKHDLLDFEDGFSQVEENKISPKDFGLQIKRFKNNCVQFNGIHYGKMIFDFHSGQCAWEDAPQKKLEEVRTFLKGAKYSWIKESISKDKNIFDENFRKKIPALKTIVNIASNGELPYGPILRAIEREGCTYVRLAPSLETLDEVFEIFGLNSDNFSLGVIRVFAKRGAENPRLFDLLPESYETDCFVTVGKLRPWPDLIKKFDNGVYKSLEEGVLKSVKISREQSPRLTKMFLCASHLANYRITPLARTDPSYREAVYSLVGDCVSDGLKWEDDFYSTGQDFIRD